MSPNRRDARIDAQLRLRLAFDSVDEFVQRYSLNISRGGIFVRTLDTRPPGTVVTLDISMGAGEGIQGKGVVRWISAPSGPGEPHREPGMGIRFTELSAESRALVDRLVASRGGVELDEPPRPPDVGAQPSGAAGRTPPPRPLAPTGPGAVAPAPRRRPTRRPQPRVVGIDLGTTNSCVAFAEGGKAQVLPSRQGHRTMPSVVAYDAHGRLLVGHAAKAQMVVNPRNTVYGSKRLVGRPFASPTVQACRDRFHYEIVEGPGGVAAVRFAGRDFSLQQVAALVLAELRETAAHALGAAVDHAVITVPAHYNDHQRNAVREAGLLAGLTVDRIVNEPTAAALAYGFGRGLDRRVLVYDLGGGTFDASVLEIQHEVYEVVSTGGDTFLGGADFDAQLMDHLVWRFMEAHGSAPPDDRVVWQRIRDAAEETKVALSSREEAIAHVPFLCVDRRGRDLELKVRVTRAELEALTGRLVDRCVDVCREVVAARGLVPANLDEVLLVGGQSRMPLVWRKIREALGREPNKSVHPDEAVALGAALLADSADRIDSVVLLDALAMGIGVGLPGGRMASVLPRNTRLPARKEYRQATTRDGQTEVELQVFQGDAQRVSECEYLGTVRVGGLPPRPRGELQVAVEFSLGNEGILTLRARDPVSGEVTEARLATRDTPESLREKLQIPEAQTTPAGARPLEPVRAQGSAAPPQRGLLGRLFGGRS